VTEAFVQKCANPAKMLKISFLQTVSQDYQVEILTMHDFRLPPRSRWVLRCSGILLGSEQWQFHPDWEGIAATCCVITWKSAVLKYQLGYVKLCLGNNLNFGPKTGSSTTNLKCPFKQINKINLLHGKNCYSSALAPGESWLFQKVHNEGTKT